MKPTRTMGQVLKGQRLLRAGRFVMIGATLTALALPALLGVYIKLDLAKYGEPTLDWGEGAWAVVFITALYAAGIVALAAFARRRFERASDDNVRLRIFCTTAGALAGALILSLPLLIDVLEDEQSRVVLAILPFGFAFYQTIGAAIGAALGGFPWVVGSERPGRSRD